MNNYLTPIHRLFRYSLLAALLLYLPGTAFATTEWVITGNNQTVRLTADHNGPIVINGNNITLDCNNHTVFNDGTAPLNCGLGHNEDRCGILASEKSYTSVVNCTVRGFDFGIRLDYTSNSSVRNNYLINNNKAGLRLDHETVSDTTRQIYLNTMSNNGEEGLKGYSCNGLIVYTNTFELNGRDGMDLKIGWNCYIANNYFTRNHCNGIELDFGGGTTIYSNTIASSGTGGCLDSSGASGISLDSVNSFAVTSNVLRQNIKDGIRVDDGSTNGSVSGNDAYHGGGVHDLHDTGNPGGTVWTNNSFATACGMSGYGSCEGD